MESIRGVFFLRGSSHVNFHLDGSEKAETKLKQNTGLRSTLYGTPAVLGVLAGRDHGASVALATFWGLRIRCPR